MYWHISWKVWFIYSNVCCCNGCSCCWVNVNKSKKMVSLVAKIEYVIINSNWMQEIMAGQKKKLRYSEETPWFPEYYISWIGIGNCDQETSTRYLCVFQICFLPSLNTQSCIKGLLVVRDFCFRAVWAAGPVLKKKLGRLWATFEGGFFIFSGAKFIF